MCQETDANGSGVPEPACHRPTSVPLLTLCPHLVLASIPTPLSACQSPACSSVLSSDAASFRKESLISPHQHLLYLFTLPFSKCVYSYSSFIRLRDPQSRGPGPWTSMCDTGSAGAQLCDLGQTCSLSTSFFSAHLAGSPGGLEGGSVSAFALRLASNFPCPPHTYIGNLQ